MIQFEEVPGCIHNKMVKCPRCCRDCSRCGWNPGVARERLLAFVRKNPEYVKEFAWMCCTGAVKG